LKLLAEGNSVKEIANDLTLSDTDERPRVVDPTPRSTRRRLDRPARAWAKKASG